MEPAGLAAGVIALAGLFNNAVDCFEYVQIGRAFQKSFTTSVLKIDDTRLRLSRWGEAVGFSGQLSDVQVLNTTFASPQDIKYVKDRLEQILELFAQAERVSQRFRSRSDPTSTDLQLYDPEVDLRQDMQVLHVTMRDLSIRRQNHSSLRQKAKWALYEEKHFRRLIEDLNDLVTGLIELFPATKAVQQELCVEEVSKFNTDEAISIMRGIAAEQDKYLDDALTKVAQSQNVHSIIWNNHDNTKVGNQMHHQIVHGGQTFTL